jgi:hypothetical protein
MMSEESPIQIPNAMRWRFKTIRKLLKETVPMTPNNGTTSVKPGQRIIVDLPFNSTVDLSTFTWFFKGQTSHLGASDTGADGFSTALFFPRNSSSVIQSMQIKINGGIKVDIPDYNFVYNMLHDYTQGADALKRRQVGGENSDPSNKLYMVGNNIVERRGYSIGRLQADDTLNDVLRDRQEYCVRSWLSLLGGNASTNIIDTQMLGVCTIELVLAPASILMKSTENTGLGAAIPFADANVYKREVNRTALAANIALTGVDIDGENVSYTLSDLEFRIVRYLMPREFYDSLANSLGSGTTFKLWFPNYSVYTGNAVAATRKDSVTTFSISTKSLDYVIGTFRLPNYDRNDLPLNTIFSPVQALQEGATNATAESQINAGCRRVYNQSRYFAHNGDSIKTTQWRIGNTPYEPQTLKEQFNSLLQHFNIHQDTLSGMHPCINSLGAFREHSYASICSLNIPGENEMYTISGLDTEQTPATVEFKVVAEPYTATDITPANTVCTPYLIAAYNSCLEIKAGRIVSLIP